jgi:ABC-type sugar transport system ATPase subunit
MTTGNGIRLEGVEKRYHDQPVLEGLNFEVREGEFMAVVGPSGCGKSTLMRIVAGVEPVQGGRVFVGGKDVTGAHPGRRGLAMVFQDYALYPHMTVEKNLSFGLRARRVPKPQIHERVQRTAETLGLSGLLDRKPSQLSGGQRQRVALGRAMVGEPRAYLMDEPLSNLDAALRVQMRAELIEFHQRVAGTVLYVTHDQVEAMTMGDRVAVMRDGRFEQIGSSTEVYERPANTFVATFLGSPKMNLLPGRVRAEAGRAVVTAGSLEWQLAEGPVRLPEQLTVGYRPEAVRIAVEHHSTPDHAVFTAPERFRENLGSEVILHHTLGDVAVTARLPSLEARMLDGEVRFAVPASELHLFTPEGDAVWHGASLRNVVAA